MRERILDFICKYGYVITLIILLSQSYYCKAQKKNYCDSIDHSITPIFADNSNDFDDPIIKEKLLIKPIKESNACLEIRMFVSNVQRITGYVIQCSNDSVSVCRYKLVLLRGNLPKSIRGYVYIGKLLDDTSVSILAQIKRGIQLQNGITWNKYFDSLVKNHLYDLPDEHDLQKLIDKQANYGEYEQGQGNDIIRFNIKAGNHYRSVLYSNLRAPLNKTVVELEYYKNLTILLSQFN